MTGFLSDPATQLKVLGLLLAYCRIQACMLALPGFSMQGLPVRVRVAAAMAVTPLLSEHAQIGLQSGTLLQLGLLCASEVLTGLALGLLVRIFTMSIDIAASAIAANASLSQIIGIANEFSPHPIGNFMHLAGIALLMALGYPGILCEMLQASFELKPAGQLPQIAELMPQAVALTGRGFMLAMILAAPFILGGFLFQLLSGMISKVMPALPVTFIAAPGAVLLALLALVLLTSPILSVWGDAVFNVIGSDLP